MIKVVVIDDGLYGDNKIKIDQSYTYRFGKFIKVKNYKGIKYNHGTICANIINAPNTTFTSIKIIKKGHSVCIETLKKAIEFSLELSPDIIHISLGTFDWAANVLRKAISNANESSNVIIISSADVYGRTTYPACIDNVIGVSYSEYVSENEYAIVSPNIAGVNVYTNVPNYFLDGHGSKITIPKTSSYAAAAVTHKLCLWLQEGVERNINHFLYSLDNRYAGNIYSHILDDRILVVMYKEKKPTIENDFIFFAFSEILCYDISSKLSLSQLQGKKLCIAFDKSVTLIENGLEIERLINNNDIVLIASEYIHKSIINLAQSKTITIWHNPSNYSVYNRLNAINKEKKVVYFDEMSSFLKYMKHMPSIFPVTTNPLNEIYGIVYTDDKKVLGFIKNMKHDIIACIK